MNHQIINYGPTLWIGTSPLFENQTVVGDLEIYFGGVFRQYRSKVIVYTLQDRLVHMGAEVPEAERIKAILKRPIVVLPNKFAEFQLALPKGFDKVLTKEGITYVQTPTYDGPKIVVPVEPVLPQLVVQHQKDIIVVEHASDLLSEVNKSEQQLIKGIDEKQVDLKLYKEVMTDITKEAEREKDVFSEADHGELLTEEVVNTVNTDFLDTILNTKSSAPKPAIKTPEVKKPEVKKPEVKKPPARKRPSAKKKGKK